MKRASRYLKGKRWVDRNVPEVAKGHLGFETTDMRRGLAMYGYLAGYRAGLRAARASSRRGEGT